MDGWEREVRAYENRQDRMWLEDSCDVKLNGWKLTMQINAHTCTNIPLRIELRYVNKNYLRAYLSVPRFLGKV